ncbi:MAG: metallophosphoesterase [Clostridia bacterium]|nr:metallophosphoesterase [Clostridia bacterium]
MLKTKPAVFAAGNNYHIMVPVNVPTLMWVKVGDKCYYDASNGIMRSEVKVHTMLVPMDILDKEKKYTICVRKIIERKPYFTEVEDVVEYPFDFKPVSGENVRAYHIADAHTMVEFPVKAAKTYGDIDFLILNGDLPSYITTEEDVFVVYEIAEKLTGGNIPIVFSRGNHDMRGVGAELFAQCTPCVDGKSYYTVRLGNIWMLILDCAEDKPDDHEAYGHTVCCHDFRMAQTEFIKDVIKNAENEYNADGTEHKMVIVHNPFTCKLKPPFDIEEDIYKEWSKLLRDSVKPRLLLCGHTHKLAVNEVGGEKDAYGQPCTMVVGAEPEIYDPKVSDKKSFKGAGLCFKNGEIEVTFTNCSGEVLGTHTIK